MTTVLSPSMFAINGPTKRLSDYDIPGREFIVHNAPCTKCRERVAA